MHQTVLSAAATAGWSISGRASVDGWLPGSKREDDFIVHDSTNWETLPSSFGTEETTQREKLYVCNHLPFPDHAFVAKPSNWTLEVEGAKHSRSVSIAELQSLGSESVTMVLQCAGNGRRFFDHQPEGPNWGIGAVGCVHWTGVPVKRVLDTLGGVDGNALYATATGGEPLNPLLDKLFSMRVERSIPLEKALDDCLLAWHMNGAPISLRHGGPLRLIVPGYFGVNQIKYLRKLAFTQEQSDADVMQMQYRYRPVGEAPAPTQPTTWAMSAKSCIWPVNTSPLRRSTMLHGVAFGGLDPVKSVEVTWDNGGSWHPVRFSGPDMGRYAWRQFEFPLNLPSGDYRVASRATDTAGRRQPEWRTQNAGGYGNASWQDHAVQVEVV